MVDTAVLFADERAKANRAEPNGKSQLVRGRIE